MKVRKSAEDYLEAMLMIKEKLGSIRSIDISEQMHVTKPSVTYATKRLREQGLILMDNDGQITLTDTGIHIARQVYERHKNLAFMLIRLGVSDEIAHADACRVEHDLSQESYDAICAYALEKGIIK